MGKEKYQCKFCDDFLESDSVEELIQHISVFHPEEYWKMIERVARKVFCKKK